MLAYGKASIRVVILSVLVLTAILFTKPGTVSATLQCVICQQNCQTALQRCVSRCTTQACLDVCGQAEANCLRFCVC